MSSYPQLKGRYSRADLEKIIGKAQSLYGKEDETIDQAALDATARELDIPEKYIHAAITALKEENAIKEKSRKTMRLALAGGAAATAVIAVVIVAALVTSTPDGRLQGIRKKYYNQIVALDENVNTQRAQVENVIQRRFELIPKLTALVREYDQSEGATVSSLAVAQNTFGRATSLADKTRALGQLDTAFGLFGKIVNANPSIRSEKLYGDLMVEIAGSDNRIAVERKRYNDAVGEYNKFVRQYPLVDYVEALGFPKEQAYWNFSGKR